MNLRTANESFKRLYESVDAQKAHLTEAEVPVIDQLRGKLHNVCADLKVSGNYNIKAYEVAFQDVIEQIFPDQCWWQVVNINIFNDLFNGRDPYQTVENICNSVKPEFIDSTDDGFELDGYDEAELEECANKLCEAQISDEDKHDSDLIRAIINKMHVRRNAALTQEEKDVLKKYNLQKREWNRDITDAGNAQIATGPEMGYSYSNGGDTVHRRFGPSKGDRINYADRARKSSERKDTRIIRHSAGSKAWEMDMNNMSTNSSKVDRYPTYQDAELIDQEFEMSQPVRTMKNALRSRKAATTTLSTVDKKYADAVHGIAQRAQKEMNAAAATRDRDRSYSQSKLDTANSTIDDLLRRNKTESINEEVEDEKYFQVTYDSNGVYSAVMVKAENEEDAAKIYNEIKGHKYPKVYGVKELYPIEVETNVRKGMSTLN